MRKIIFCLLIILLAACSNKKNTDEDKIVNSDLSNAPWWWTEEEFNNDKEIILLSKKDYVLSNYLEGRESYTHHYPLIGGYYLSVNASSESPDYPAGNLINGTWLSWVEGARGNGTGESFTLTLLDESPIAGFALKNGFGNLDYYSQNNRVKSFKIHVNGNYIETVPIKDSISFEQYIFEEPVICKEIRFVIDDVYQGTKFDDTCVAEIALLRRPVDTAEFYENILYWVNSGDDGYYESNNRQIVSVPDTERLLLMEYLPFDVPYNYYWDNNTGQRVDRKTKIAFLGGASSLRLSGNLPRLDGATAMYPLYSSFVRAVYPQVNFDMNGSYVHALYKWAYFPNADLLLNDDPPSDIYYAEFESIVQCNTTSTAFRRLIEGETDIIFCYEPSREEISAAEENGKRFNLTPIAYDAFVFIVNNKNTLNNISQQRIRDIYSGRVTNWNFITGVDEPVIAYQRPENSGSQTILQSIMKEDQLIRPILDGEFIPKGMFGMILKIASDYYNYNSAIGYSFLFYLTQMAGDSGIKVLSVDGVAPTRQTIQNKTYPFIQTVYAITTGNESENTKKFIEWILSAQGQELVAKTGYTPVR
jgi:phosphate transport system substrate-binding protein